MAETPKPDKTITFTKIASKDPDLVKLLGALAPEMQEWFSKLTFDIRIDVSSFTSVPYETTVMDQVALASMDHEQAADSIIEVTDKATDGAFDHVGPDGQAELVQWILKGYFPDSTVPVELLAAIDRRLKKEESGG